MPQGGLHILQHYPHPLHRMAYHSLLLLYCTVSNRPPQNDILLFVLQAQEASMLCRIGSHLTGGQSNTRKLQALSRMFYQREACSGTKRVTHSQSRSRSCLPCRESGKSCIWHVKGCSNSDSIKQFPKLYYSYFCARRSWKKAKSSRDPLPGWKLNYFWPIRKLMLVFKEVNEKAH